MAEETEEELLNGLEPLNVEEMICDDQDDGEKDETLNEYLNVRFPSNFSSFFTLHANRTP